VACTVFSPEELKWEPHPNQANAGVFLKPLLAGGLDPHLRTSLVKVEPGGKIAPHTHTTLEFFTVLQGEAMALVNGSEVRLTPGMSVYAPPGDEHALRNATSEPLLLLACFAPAE
jgi:quercetin dioxygenase-like cupin family protein